MSLLISSVKLHLVVGKQLLYVVSFLLWSVKAEEDERADGNHRWGRGKSREDSSKKGMKGLVSAERMDSSVDYFVSPSEMPQKVSCYFTLKS